MEDILKSYIYTINIKYNNVNNNKLFFAQTLNEAYNFALIKSKLFKNQYKIITNPINNSNVFICFENNKPIIECTINETNISEINEILNNENSMTISYKYLILEHKNIIELVSKTCEIFIDNNEYVAFINDGYSNYQPNSSLNIYTLINEFLKNVCGIKNVINDLKHGITTINMCHNIHDELVINNNIHPNNFNNDLS
jgi:hypothetical protein